ncbi:MAG: hypothetical protein A2W61_01670 [Deltaproteobacteria bacterium RIFCSPLOWO2_01_44_7]|nr:MAG: hypothetical protein A2712_05490 [Deltaproteobacteria bacterium RIFCSPHIGHO2_01_FULL_43_49]OGQ14344.1 MAG: hypothetical protein A3D22_04895 [Deltaproteobacteria bacterium RIFCSPHIGHO2_02_FULL_44_53]OGQ27616.1 MAG: hypothetical protein A3D98_09280 [Deltaproteobacteria bacterium RIFCSPHIGHO2_12_FULL_44_21]OGQ30785.1 MAG: hypothetical protein A2979_01305 [Deltaproteobacteria bacterium RIFCSPLOWO2_01_FULL_45_74]OGQ42465.1 MAG: hypothetical protein A3I70_10830 [Deltaproteobacteria bacterium 
MWQNIFGHKNQIEQLKKELKEKKLAHAYLFSGIEGIGKKQIALGLVQALRCSKSDLHFIEPEGLTIKVELLRRLKQKIYLHPLEGEVKVVIIDNAHMMTEAGANALLKILEEPPQATYFILISHQPTRLLPTIRSRCRQMTFGPLSHEQIKQYLVRNGLSQVEAEQKTNFAMGSLKMALDFDVNLAGEINQKLTELSQGLTPSKILDLSETLSEESEKLPYVLILLEQLWHKKILENGDAKATERLTTQWTAIQNATRGLQTYANKQLLIESLLFTLANG